jgi:nucleoside phosphorylase
MIGIVTGLAEEADAIVPGLGEVVVVQGISVRRVEIGGVPVAVACAGIGKVAAATAATLLATGFDATLLMVVGTAGGLADDVGGAPHWLSGAIQHDYGAARPDRFVHYDAGAWPIGPETVTAFKALPQPEGLGLPEAVIASGDCFVECGVRAGTIRDALGARLVDMETAAVAQVAAILGLPWCAIKAATDEANADSAGDFHTNLAATARRAAVTAERAVGLLAAQTSAV